MDLDNAASKAINSVMQNPTRQNIEHHLRMMYVAGYDYCRGNANFTRPVIQMSKYGDKIKWWPSAVEAAKALGVDKSSVRKAASGVKPTCRGYVWQYA